MNNPTIKSQIIKEFREKFYEVGTYTLKSGLTMMEVEDFLSTSLDKIFKEGEQLGFAKKATKAVNDTYNKVIKKLPESYKKGFKEGRKETIKEAYNKGFNDGMNKAIGISKKDYTTTGDITKLFEQLQKGK